MCAFVKKQEAALEREAASCLCAAIRRTAAPMRESTIRRREERRMAGDHWRARPLTAFSICSKAFVRVHRGQATFMRRKASPCSPNS